MESGHGVIAYANWLQLATSRTHTDLGGIEIPSQGITRVVPSWSLWFCISLMEVGGIDAFYDQVAEDASVICIRSKPLGTMEAHSMWPVAASLFLAIPSHLSISPAILCIWKFGRFLTLRCGFYFNGPSPKAIFVHRKAFVFWREMKIGVSCFHHPTDDALSQLLS